MHLTRFFNVGVLFATLAHAVPADTEPDNETPTSIVQLPEADPRFAHIRLAHPHAQIHVPHPTDLARLEALKLNNSNISKRDGPAVYGVYECSKPKFKGDCQWTQVLHNEKKCHNAKYWPNGSIGPDKGVKCIVFQGADCNYRRNWGYALEWPGCPDCAESHFMWDYGMDACPLSWNCDWGT